MWKCLYLPWHKLKRNKIYETGSEQIKCSCGKLYAMSGRTRSFVRWDGDLEVFYKDVKFTRKYED